MAERRRKKEGKKKGETAKMKNVRNKILATFLAMVMVVTVSIPGTKVKAEVTLPAATNISFDSARDLTFDSSIAEEMAVSDDVRYYKFSLDNACEMIIKGTSSYWNAKNYFIIYDETKTEVYSFTGYGENYNNTFYLTGGQYYLKLESCYIVSFVATINSLEESFTETQNQNNDMIDNAYSINLKEKYKGVVASNDDMDYFKMTVPANGKINFNMTNSAECDLKYVIYDDSINMVYTNTVSSGKKISEYIKLSKNEYYIAITKLESNTLGGSYVFTIDYVEEKISKPVINSVKNSASRKMTVKWTKIADVTGYELQYSTNKGFKSGVTKKKLSSDKVSVSYAKLKKGKKYYVRIRAYVTTDDTTKYSNWSAVKSVKIKK